MRGRRQLRWGRRPRQDGLRNGHAIRHYSIVTRRARLPWYPWHVGDYLRDTRGWPLVARAIFRELLDAQWDAPAGTLPDDEDKLRAIVGATLEEWSTGWTIVAPRFPLRRGRRRNEPLAQLRRRTEVGYEKRRAAGRKAARDRWGRRSEARDS